jgi:ABC-type transport system involved in multi-copper enzyme maturation permease subunit
VNVLFLKQITAVICLEIKKTFLSKRSIWIYLLAYAPVLIFIMHSINEPRQKRRLAEIAAEYPVSTSALNSIGEGAGYDDVLEKLGTPYNQNFRTHRRGPGPEHEFGHMNYTDGRTDVILRFYDKKVVRVLRRQLEDLPRSQMIFATVFQFYYLRLAVFFGCVGVFVNLFRGEMLDKSMHFYLLTPVRREVLLAGKYLSGLIATIIIFTSSTALQWTALLFQFERGVIMEFFNGPGIQQFWIYLGITVLACAAYGALSLTIGLLLRNPVIPTVVILLWEGINPFLPLALKKVSIIYYLQSLCPVAASQENDLPDLVKFLLTPPESLTSLFAVVSLVGLTSFMLLFACFLARRLQINYSKD